MQYWYVQMSVTSTSYENCYATMEYITTWDKFTLMPHYLKAILKNEGADFSCFTKKKFKTQNGTYTTQSYLLVYSLF